MLAIAHRLREEHDRGTAPQRAGAQAIQHGAPTVAAAGLILAGTIGGVQQGFTLAVGILLTSYVMASIMIPSIAATLGPAMWWPTGRTSANTAQGPLVFVPAEVREAA